MAAGLQPNTTTRGVKRDAQGHPRSQIQQSLEISPDIRNELEQIPTTQLISVFEPAIREHLRHRIPEGDLENMLEDVKSNISRDKIMKLACLLPLVMAEVKERNHESRALHPVHAGTQAQDTQMELFPHTSPPPPYEVHLRPSGVVPSDPNHPFSNGTISQRAEPLTPPREPTIYHGLYTPGIGRSKTSEKRFEIAEVNYVRALAWARRTLAFDRSNEHLIYHLKTVLSKDFQLLLNTLANLGIVEPAKPPPADASISDATKREDAFKTAQVEYHQIVAQSVYKLPTVWPATADFLADLNHEKSRELLPQRESDPYIDVTELIRRGSNVFTIVEFKDMRKYTFCLFEKRPTDEEIEEAAQNICSIS